VASTGWNDWLPSRRRSKSSCLCIADQYASRPQAITVVNRVALAVLCLWSIGATAATIDVAHDQSGKPLSAITLEGDIEPGDLVRLEIAVEQFDIIHEPHVAARIYLRSRGGDVEEAMKLGSYIRRLRLETEAPTKVDGNSDIMSFVSPAAGNNNICASACFLIFAGGVRRHGNLLALHRPYLPKSAARKISDLDYEAIEKSTMIKVALYLKNMEIDQFFIDKMMTTDSQDAYVVSLWETDKYHLHGTVPSIEESILARCTELSSTERGELDAKRRHWMI